MMKVVKTPEDFAHLKHYYFRLNSPYKWGQGMHASQSKEIFQQFTEILHKIGFEIICDGTQSSISHCPKAWEGENYLYCHPMDISGYLTEEKFQKAKEVIENYNSNLFTVRKIDALPVVDYGVSSIERNVAEYKKRKEQNPPTSPQ